MPTKGSREIDSQVDRASRDMDGIEHERNKAMPAGPDTHSAGAIGGGDHEGRKGKIWSGKEGKRTSKDE